MLLLTPVGPVLTYALPLEEFIWSRSEALPLRSPVTWCGRLLAADMVLLVFIVTRASEASDEVSEVSSLPTQIETV